jgi:DNA-binding transcriptional MocR family regulator
MSHTVRSRKVGAAPVVHSGNARTKGAAQAGAAPQLLSLSREAGDSLVKQMVRNGTRMPSIRQFADEHGVSRLPVVEAYDRLVAGDHIESRRGSGFVLRERAFMMRAAASHPSERADRFLDAVWPVRNMFRNFPAEKTPRLRSAARCMVSLRDTEPKGEATNLCGSEQ